MAQVGDRFIEAFNVRLVEHTTAAWEFYFGVLERFVEREHHALVPAKWREDDVYRLGSWVTTQRILFRRGTLESERSARLEAVRGWTWNPQDDAWDEGFAKLKSFVKREGHARVPQQCREDGYRLGEWVINQRAQFQREMLDPERRARLEAIPGRIWAPRHDAWEEGFAKLESFVKREHHAWVPAQWREDDFRLGQWVTMQRSGFHRGTLERERRARLEAVPGWTWDTREALWEERFSKLRSFVEREGHARVPAQWRESDFRLGQWVINQRARVQVNTDRARRLEALPGWTWGAREAAWEEGFAKLETFVEREGHAWVPQQWREDSYRLGAWVRNQRNRKGTLGPERRARLEALSGWAWDARQPARAP